MSFIIKVVLLWIAAWIPIAVTGIVLLTNFEGREDFGRQKQF